MRSVEELMDACMPKNIRKLDKSSIIELHREVHEFLRGDYPEEDKKKLISGMRTEPLDMIYDAIKRGLM